MRACPPDPTFATVCRIVHGLRNRFAALVSSGARLDLGRAALEIARIAYPHLDPVPPLAELDRLADQVRARITPGAAPATRADQLLAVVFEVNGFRGNQADYYDPRNSFLNDVLARRLGIPISLAVVVMEVGRRAGVSVSGVGFPGHFLVRLPGPDGSRLVDPFHAGATLTDADLRERLRALSSGSRGPQLAAVPPEFLQPVPATAILARMLRNLLRVWQDRGDAASALAAVDLLLVLGPDTPEEVKTRGLLYAELECFAAAADDFRRYLTLAPDAADADAVRDRLAQLHDTVPTLH